MTHISFGPVAFGLCPVCNPTVAFGPCPVCNPTCKIMGNYVVALKAGGGWECVGSSTGRKLHPPLAPGTLAHGLIRASGALDPFKVVDVFSRHHPEPTKEVVENGLKKDPITCSYIQKALGK
jgi:hypothetical protein